MTHPLQKNSSVSRRHFLKTAGVAAVLPLILPGCLTTRGGKKISANAKINVGIIGWGMQGPANAQNFLNEPDCRVVAVCDVDRAHLQAGVNAVNEHYSAKDCAAYANYLELFARPDLDAVMIAVPDHWHALIATAAARRGLHIYGEKPLAKTIAEQQAIVRAVEKSGIIWQTGSWQRSTPMFHKAAEIIRNGLIGEITRVEVGLPGGHYDFVGDLNELIEKLKPLGTTDMTQIRPGSPAWDIAVTAPATDFNFEQWLGPSRAEPYIKQRIHRNWRWNYNTGGGQLLDWVGHHVDIAHWALGFDDSGPLEIEGQGSFPPADAIWNTCGRYRIELKYPRGIAMTIAGGHDEIKNGVKFFGSEGWLWVSRSDADPETPGGFAASNPEWRKLKSLPENLRKVQLCKSPGHTRNFLDSIRSGKPTITPVQAAHHSAIPGHLGLIAMQTGRKLRWDAAREKIIGDPAAAALLARPYRESYSL